MAIWTTSGYRDCFPDSSLLGDTESGINRQRCATLQCRTCTSRHRRNNYDVITSPADDRQPRQPVMVNDIATLVRRALAEVCTVAVLLVRIVYVCTTSNINKCGSGKNTRKAWLDYSGLRLSLKQGLAAIITSCGSNWRSGFSTNGKPIPGRIGPMSYWWRQI